MNKSSAVLCSLIQVYAAYGMEQSVSKSTANPLLYAGLLDNARQLLRYCELPSKDTSHSSELLQSYCPKAHYLKQAISLLEAQPVALEEQHTNLLTAIIFAPLTSKMDLDMLAQKLGKSERAGVVSEARKNVLLQEVEKTFLYTQKVNSNARDLMKSLSQPQVDGMYVQLYREYTDLLQHACQEMTCIQKLSERAKSLLKENLVASPRQSKRNESHKESA